MDAAWITLRGKAPHLPTLRRVSDVEMAPQLQEGGAQLPCRVEIWRLVSGFAPSAPNRPRKVVDSCVMT